MSYLHAPMYYHLLYISSEGEYSKYTSHHIHTDKTVLSGQFFYNTPYFAVKTKQRRKTITIRL